MHNKLTKHNYEISHLTINHMYFDGSRIGSKDQKKRSYQGSFPKKEELQKMYINLSNTVYHIQYTTILSSYKEFSKRYENQTILSNIQQL